MCVALSHSSPEAATAYLLGMEQSIPFKMELIAPWVENAKTIVDLGTALGSLAYGIAQRQKNSLVFGLDLSDEVLAEGRKLHKADNLLLDKGNILNYNLKTDAVVCSSILHEVFSYTVSASHFGAVEKALNNIRKNLQPGGRLIIRDFVQPTMNPVLNLWHKESDMKEGHTFGAFYNYLHGTYPDAHKEGEGLRYSSVHMRDIYEFIYRKDFHANWDAELQETYGFWTAEQAKALLELAGFEIEHYSEMDNGWITKNRLEGKVALTNIAGYPVSFPKYQMLIVAKKA